MDVWQVLAQVLVAALAVIGFYETLHGVFEAFLRPRQLVWAVEIRTMADAANLDILLCEARRSPYRRRGEGVVLVIHAELMDGRMGVGNRLHEEYEDLARRYDALVCVTTEEI